MHGGTARFDAYRSSLWLLAGGFTLLGAAFAFMGSLGAAAGAGGVLLVAAAGARARSAPICVGAGVLATFFILETAPSPFGYHGTLALEAVAATLPLAALALVRFGGHGARRAVAATQRVPLAAAGLLVAALGVAVRAGEIRLIWGQPGTLATIRYILRGDLAETFWAIAALATAGAYLYAAHATTRAPGRSLRRAVTGAVAALALFSFVGYDVGTAVAASVHGPVAVEVGLHANDVENLPPEVRLAQIDVAWDRVEPRHGQRDWSYYDHQVRLAEERGLDLYLIANTYPPDWLARLRPDSVMVDQDGSVFTWIDESPGHARGRVWDLSFHDDLVLRMKQDFARAVAERYAGSPAVRWVSIQNEPTYPVDWNLVRYASYDNTTVDAFREHLRLRYGTVEALNENASAEWTTFDEAEAPRHPFAPLWQEWMRFREDALIALVDGLVEAVRPVASEKPVTVKIMAHGLTRFAQPQSGLSDRVLRSFANASDVVSVDVYPHTLADLRRSLDYFEHISEGKPIVIAEFNLLLGTNLPTGGARLVNHLLAMDGRVEAVFLFTADEHWLYGMSTHARSPGLAAVALATSGSFDGRRGAALGSLLVEDVLAVQNVYYVYSMGMVAAGIPVLPWPVLLLAAAPIPIASERARLGIGGVKVLALAAILALLWI